MKKNSTCVLNCVIIVSLLLFSGCGVYQGKTKAGGNIEFLAYGLGFDYFAVDFGGMKLLASGSPHLTLPLGIFAENLLSDRGLKIAGVILLGYFAFGTLRYVEPGNFMYSGIDIGPMRWHAKNVWDAPTLFPTFFDKVTTLKPDEYVGNNSLDTAFLLEIKKREDFYYIAKSGIVLEKDKPDCFRFFVPEDCYVSVITTSFNCGVESRAVPKLMNSSGETFEKDALALIGREGFRLNSGEYFIKVSPATDLALDFVRYDLFINATPSK